VSNDYVYHNIGDQITFLNDKREPLKTVETTYPLTGKDYPGFRFYTNVKKLESYSGDLIARFTAKNEQSEEVYMQALIEGNGGRTYYQAFSPKTKTSGRQYHDKDLPLFTIRTEAEAKTKPFILIFEPYKGEKGNSVERISVEKRNDGDLFTSLTVFSKGGVKQQIYQSVDPAKNFTSGGGTFSGYFGVAGYAGEKLTSIYLGKGTMIAEGGYSLKSMTADGSANLKTDGKGWEISCNQETEVGLPMPKVKKVILRVGTNQKELKISRSEKGIQVTVPKVENGVLVQE
jgi:hypothetical protein